MSAILLNFIHTDFYCFTYRYIRDSLVVEDSRFSLIARFHPLAEAEFLCFTFNQCRTIVSWWISDSIVGLALSACARSALRTRAITCLEGSFVLRTKSMAMSYSSTLSTPKRSLRLIAKCKNNDGIRFLSVSFYGCLRGRPTPRRRWEEGRSGAPWHPRTRFFVKHKRNALRHYLCTRQ